MSRNTNNKKKKATSPEKGPVEAGEKNGPRYTIDQLLDKARGAIDTFEFEIAQKFCERVLEIDADNVTALEMSGQLLLDQGNDTAAKHCFVRAVELSPDSGHSKYMYLGQISTGAEAVDFFHKGIDVMIKTREAEAQMAAAGATNPTATVSKREISNAYCALAELYMTDCCDDDEAEKNCREYIEKAVAADEFNPEAFQLYASFLLVLKDLQNAREKIKQSIDLWLPSARQLDTDAEQPNEGDEDLVAEANEEFDDLNPYKLGYQTRIHAAQILIEVEEYDTASEVLECLLDENDEIVDVWQLLGWVHYLQGEDYYNNARHYLNKAKEVLMKTGDEDEDMKAHVDELLTALGPGPAVDPDEPVVDEEVNDLDEEAESSDVDLDEGAESSDVDLDEEADSSEELMEDLMEDLMEEL